MYQQTPNINIEFEEDVDGVRFNWNRWPSSRVELEKLVLSLGCLYTPLKEPYDARYHIELQQDPITCFRSTCKAVINPFCYPDLQSQPKSWICNFCNQRNQFPRQYQHITNPQQIPELCRNTIDYLRLDQPVPHPPIFIYIIDSCVEDEEFESLKSSIVSSISLLPPNSLVGLITFNHIVYLWELASSKNLKTHVFDGQKDYKPEWLRTNLFLGKNDIYKFIQPASQLNIINDILEQVARNTWPSVVGRRPSRAAGSAISVAISLLETTFLNTAARIMLFLGGPCTIGPGMVVDDDLKNTIRSHHDIDKDNIKYLKKASDFYQQLANRASLNGHAFDIFSSALDQTGLFEMKHLTNMTNGLLVMGDSFDSNLFKTSFQRIFAKDKKGNLKMAFNAVLEVKTSRELKVTGAIGSCIGLNKKNSSVATDKRDGIGNTAEWKFCSLIPSSTTALYFVVQNTPSVSQGQQSPCGHVQFITSYSGSDGYKHIRVTTIRRYIGTDDFEFDQESAAVLLARMACYKSDAGEHNGGEILRWLDRSLIRVCQKFGDYHPNSPESFRFKEAFTMLPQFLFNMRRSQFIQVFNNSPDETTFYRHSLMREDCSNSLLMIQPALVAYELHQEPQPVSLDTASITPDRILLMDTFFQIVIFHGEKIAAWRKAKFQEKEGYESFKLFLEAPINDANDLMIHRFPLPRYVVCDQGSSQARFVLSRVNPSVTHNTAIGYYGDPSLAPVLSDDVSYAVFEEHLRKLIVQGSQ